MLETALRLRWNSAALRRGRSQALHEAIQPSAEMRSKGLRATLQLIDLLIQKKPRARNFSARNSGAGNGCANFMDAWHFLVLSAGKTPCP